MKFKIKYTLYYKNRSSSKVIVVNNCDSEEHCIERFDVWVKKKYSNAKDITIDNTEKLVDMNPADIFGKSFGNIFENIFGNTN